MTLLPTRAMSSLVLLWTSAVPQENILHNYSDAFFQEISANCVSQSINKTPSCFLSLVLVNATVKALPLLETSFTSAVRVWEICQTSRAAAEQSPAIPVCFGTGGMHRSSEWVEEQGFEVCVVMLYYSWLFALWKIHCTEFSALLRRTVFLEAGEGWF